ncbi:hypothetical protein [Nostoc sp. C110]|uniref:hypothetical protein n=1 Tax=Nostoc sp. C110 TaxID=3349876 RepID=UPI00370DA275
MLFTGAYDRAWVPQKPSPPLPTFLARLFYQMWATAGQYTDPGMDYYEQKYQEMILKNLRNKAHAQGLEIVPISPEQQNTLSSPTLDT